MTILYDSSKTVNLLLRVEGTIWPHVLPWCVFFMLIYPLRGLLNEFYGFKFSEVGSSSGITILVALLVVMLGELQYRRFTASVTLLFQCVGSIKRIAILTAIYCGGDSSDSHVVEYRRNVSIALEEVIQILSETLSEHDITSCLNVNVDCDFPDPAETIKKLGDLISEQRHMLGEKYAMPILKEIQILGLVDQIFFAYEEMAAYAQTPMPFPLINLGRTIVMVYLFFIPVFILGNNDPLNFVNYLVVFFSVYGYLGLELVFSDLEDPFGDDPTDVEIESLLSRARQLADNLLKNDTPRYFEVEEEYEIMDANASVATSTYDSSIFDDDEHDVIDEQKMFLQLGRAQLDMDNYDRAEHFLNETIRYAGDTPEAAMASELLGDATLRRGYIELSLKHYQTALCLYPSRERRPHILMKSGHAYFKLSDLNESLYNYKKALECFDSNRTSYKLKSIDIQTVKFRVGLILLHEKKYREALTALRDVVELEGTEALHDKLDEKKSQDEASKYSHLYVCMGLAHEGLGQTEWAISMLTEASIIQKKFLGEYTCEVLDTTAHLIRLYKKTDDEEIKEALIKKAQRIKDGVLEKLSQEGNVSVLTQWKENYETIFK